jgi:1-acyl-sn-glycerol-3-phosphate acyltransferase
MNKFSDDISFQQQSDSLLSHIPFLNKIASPLQRRLQQTSRSVAMLIAIVDGFYVAAKHNTKQNPNLPENTRLVRYFCRRLCDAVRVDVTVHGEMPEIQALWVSNHISWLDIPVVGSVSKVFFLAKAEIESWPVIGALARAGGALFIKRGSGDSHHVKNQIAKLLAQDVPILFFPEATTTDGRHIKKLHGKLLAAAIETNTPVQAVVMCYVNQQGELDMIAPFIGDMTFASHIAKVMSVDRIYAHVMPLATIDSHGHTVESLTQLLHEHMSAGLRELHEKVLK